MTAPTWPARRVTRAQLRALRALIARVECVRRRDVRVRLRPAPHGADGHHVEVVASWCRFAWCAPTARGAVRDAAREMWRTL